MKRTITHIAPWLAAAAVGGALVFAPVASAAPGHVAPSPSRNTPSASGTDPSCHSAPSPPATKCLTTPT